MAGQASHAAADHLLYKPAMVHWHQDRYTVSGRGKETRKGKEDEMQERVARWTCKVEVVDSTCCRSRAAIAAIVIMISAFNLYN